MIKFISQLLVLSALFATSVWAKSSEPLAQQMIIQLQVQYPAAEIKVVGDISWQSSNIPFTHDKVRFLTDNGKGTARFEVYGDLDSKTVRAEATINFSSIQDIFIDNRRIRPVTALKHSDFLNI
jgi:hypothetical protein